MTHMKLTAIPLLDNPLKRARQFIVRPANTTATWGLHPAPWSQFTLYAPSYDSAIERAADHFNAVFYNKGVTLYYESNDKRASFLLTQ